MSDRKALDANGREIPLIKEYRIDKLRKCLECVNEHPFNREKQRECILELYPGKSEKSVFRGMVIPSLRHLGLVLGYGSFIRLSANGKIIVESKSVSDELHQRVMRAVIYEIDERKFLFMPILTHITNLENFVPIKNGVQNIASMITAPSQRQKMERINHWLSVLEQVELIRKNDLEEITVNVNNYKQTLSDFNLNGVKAEKFKDYLFDTYFVLRKETAGVVDIAELREKVGIKMLRDDKAILTESQFDKMLRLIPFATDDYIISLGRPMGAEEKIFEHKGKHFRTFSLQLLRKEIK